MAGRIQGITVEIGGDTTKLQTALKGVNTEIRNTQSQLRDVDKLLKLDPGNTELLAQKHRLLGDAVKETKEKLETLKTAAEQAEQALKDGTITQDQYDGLQREIVETEQKLKALEEQAKASGTALQEIAAKGEKLKTVGDNITNVGKKFMPVTLGVVGLGTAAVKTAADFDSAMSKVAAVSGATGSDLEALRDKAREMGEKTKFSASEAAEAMNYMAMAGWKTEDMLSGIEGIMNLAAASGEDLATTSDIVTDALTAFGLTAKDSGHFADILAAASSNANTNVSMMGETFKYCAPIAGALGFSAEDTAEAIGLMANAGIKGSQAGTALRTIMNNLSGEVKICGSSIGEVTIATTNADGSMRELSDILADCRTAFSGLSESEKAAAAESLVGKNAMSGFLALMNAGEADINKLSSAINNCDGSAASMAETMNDNLAGQLQILKSQLEELAISFGELLMPAIRTIVGWIQKFVDWLNSMDEGTRKVIVTIALVAAAIGPVLIIVGKVISADGTIMTLVPKLAGVINAAKGVFAAFNAVCAANPYVLIIAAIVALVAAFIYLWNNCEEFRQFWIDLWESIKEIAIAVWEALKAFFQAAWEAIKTTATTVWNAIKDFFSSLWEGIKNIFITVVNAISTFLTTAWNAIKNTVTTVWNAIKTFFTTVALTDGYKFVWEFTPSQGNGTIAAVGLTSKHGGANAYGSDVAVDTTLLQIKKVSLDDGDGFINDLFRAVTVDFENSKLYALCYASNTVTIKKYRIPVFDIGLNEKLDDSTLILEDTTVLQCSTFHFYGSYTPYGIFMDGGDGYWYGFANQGNSSGSATVLWIKIRKSDYTFTEGQWTLSNATLMTMGSFKEGSSYPSGNRSAVVRNGYLYVPSYDKTGVYKINISNSTDVTLISLGFTSAMRCIGETGSTDCCLTIINDIIVAYDFEIDVNDNVIATLAGEWCGNVSTQFFQYKEYVFAWGGAYLNQYRYTWILTPYLATICNLSQAVVKNADKTMKITYTLTEQTV